MTQIGLQSMHTKLMFGRCGLCLHTEIYLHCDSKVLTKLELCPIQTPEFYSVNYLKGLIVRDLFI